MKQKLSFLVLLITLIPCFIMQSCDYEEGKTTLSEEEKVIEMFRQAGF